jgi:hypothetical protein
VVAAIAKKCVRSRHCAVEAGEAQIRLVHQRRRLQCVPGALAAHVVMRQAMQFVVKRRDERIGWIVSHQAAT